MPEKAFNDLREWAQSVIDEATTAGHQYGIFPERATLHRPEVLLDALVKAAGERDALKAKPDGACSDFIRVLEGMAEEAKAGADGWAHGDLTGFLDAMAAYIVDTGWQPDSWQSLCDLFAAARVYE